MSDHQYLGQLLATYLPIRDILLLSAVNRGFYLGIKIFWESERNDVINPFFPEANSKRSFLRALSLCDAFVSGSIPLQAASRRRFPSSDLDTYVASSNATLFAAAVTRLGFRYVPSVTQRTSWVLRTGNILEEKLELYPNRTVMDVLDFYNSAMKKLQIIITRTDPIEAVLHFHSSQYTTCYST
ncbi:hypothetical protein C8J56DRAFT_905176 [Mycena floridula]|nr:hypothetical protein C8J56DRAFT_905176 [Mycena floridula]